MNKKNNFKRTLSFRILTRFFVVLFIFTILLLLCYFFVMAILEAHFAGGGRMGKILLMLDDNQFVNLFVLWVIGFISLFVHYWSKTLGYLEDLIAATKTIYNSDNEIVNLPPELKEIEATMNQIKLSVQQGKQAVKDEEKRKDEMIVYLAHDLKTPLTSVIGYLTLLNKEDKISEELRKKYLSIALNKSERLEELIKEFFEITRFNLSNPVLDVSSVNLTRMLEQITNEFMPIFSARGLKCDLTAAPDIIIKCDANKVERVFDNVIRNAINYSYENTDIEIKATKGENGVELLFLNHGNTIPEEKLNCIFNQFYRLDTSRASATGGAGLGLAIAKKIVELHHGTIKASSKNETIEIEIFIPDAL